MKPLFIRKKKNFFRKQRRKTWVVVTIEPSNQPHLIEYYLVDAYDFNAEAGDFGAWNSTSRCPHWFISRNKSRLTLNYTNNALKKDPNGRHNRQKQKKDLKRIGFSSFKWSMLTTCCWFLNDTYQTRMSDEKKY